MHIFDIPLYLWKKDGILYQTEQKYVYFLAEHIALNQRNQTNSSHSSVTMQPDLLNQFNSNQIPNEIGTETNEFTTGDLFGAQNDFGIGTNESSFQTGTNEINFPQNDYQTGTNHISVSSDRYVIGPNRVCPSNVYGTETNGISMPENISFPIANAQTTFSDNCYGTETNGIYVNSGIETGIVPYSTNQFGTNSCTYMRNDYPIETNTLWFVNGPSNTLNGPMIKHTAFGTETNEFPPELEPNIQPYDSTTVPPAYNLNLLQSGTNFSRKRRTGTNEGVAHKFFRCADKIFPEPHYGLKTGTNKE